jgi:transposase-like protein
VNLLEKNSIEYVKCPRCYGKNIICYGYHNNKQIYYCKNCRKKFVNSGLKNKTYSPSVIINAISYYNLGNTLDETVKIINKRYKIKGSISSVHSWIDEFSDICSYKKIRSYVLRNYNDNGKIIDAFSFQHCGLTYNFMYHKPKLEMLCANFLYLKRYILKMKEECPSDFFNKNERCSQLCLNLNFNFKKEGRYNHACRLADFSLKDCPSNCKRHGLVENFMLINDSCTIACEVPVWFWEKYLDIGVCGHIDILQIRRGNIYVMDYKPDASKENDKKVSSQLFLYASGLSFRTKIPLMRFRCAWFDQNNYYEFNPCEQNFSVKLKNNLYFRKI